jgi:transposase
MSVLRVQACEFYTDGPDRPAADQELQRTPRLREIVFIVASLLLRSEVMTTHASRLQSMPEGLTPANLCSSKEGTADAVILKLKSEGFSFREISKLLGKSLGSVTGRYYRLKGVRHPSRIMRDAELKKNRKLRRTTREKERSMAAIQAAIELRRGVKFSIAVGRARAAGASLEMIGACCGVSKQTLHKKWRQHVKPTQSTRPS